MHGDVGLTPAALWAGWLLRFGVPLVCAAIVIDAARRPTSAFGRIGRTAWIVLALTLLLTLVAAFVWPGVNALQLFALAAFPLTVALGVTYLLSVVFPRRAAE